MTKLDRRRKYYIVLDCETATLPFAATLPENLKKKVAIAKPLIYDLGWQIIDGQGRVYKRQSFLISEIFSVPAIFNTAYYASKRPMYLERLAKGETTLTTWNNAVNELIEDMAAVEAVGAYNSMFDFKKAIPFTDLYISKLYSPDFYQWEEWQNKICTEIASGTRWESNKEFEPDIFRFRNVEYPLFDLWGLSAKHILNCDEYKEMCIENGWLTESGKYYKTSAETAFRFVTGQADFDERHMAIDDSIIESILFAEIAKRTKRKFEMGIIYFPFRILGRVQ